MRFLQCFVLMLYGISLGMMIGDHGWFTIIPVALGLTISIAVLILKYSIK